MMCSVRLILRLPARESRCLVCSPEEASRGAVPFQDASLSRSAKAVDVADVGQQPCGTRGPDTGQRHQRRVTRLDERGELLLNGLNLLVDALQLDDQLGREPASGLPDEVAGLDGGDYRPGLV
jgi:hypothetical protein